MFACEAGSRIMVSGCEEFGVSVCSLCTVAPVVVCYTELHERQLCAGILLFWNG